MPRTKFPESRKTLLALAAAATLTPAASWALELAQSPPLPTSKSAYAAPNVIISVDDSGSMNYGVKTGSTGSTATGPGYTEPDSNGKWKDDARRVKVLQYALKDVFSDKSLIPENKLRIAWQSMNNGSQKNVNAAGMVTNSMRPIDAVVGTNKVHRDNFLAFVNGLAPGSSTPLHRLPSQADAYMRRPLDSTSPWATDPGGTGSKATEFLGCRRNYHILMTDGRWNGAVSGGNQDGQDWPAQGDRQAYSIASDQTKVYYDNYSDTISDWAFKSWMDPLQSAASLKDSDKLKPSKVYDEAPATELFSATRNKFKIVTASGNNSTQRKKSCADMFGDWLGGSTDNCKLQDGTETKSVDLQKYWNPKYDPATWPHMVTYTIGFSDDATTWPGANNIIGPTTTVPFGYDNSFIDLVTGFQTWPDMDAENKRALDLWHAAINGRGRFYSVTEAEDLAKAFTEIIGKINEESAELPEQISPGGTSSGYNVSQSNAGLFKSVYNAKKGWSGYITASRAREPEEYACPTKIDPDAKCIKFPDPVAGWESKTTAERLDALSSVDNRLILTWSDKWASTAPKGGVPFKWANDDSNLSSAQKALLGVETTATGATVYTRGENILNFVRGDRSLEATTPPNAAKPFRTRTSRQGDIVNSEIWYTASPISNMTLSGYTDFIKAQKNRLPMLYVGGNDGMLHGFSAQDGKEQLAYVPRGVIAGLKKLADPDYEHQYYVDGSPMTGDVKDSTWKTMLVGTLGAGGKGYFVLDVTNPTAFDTASVALDRTRGNGEAAPNCAPLTGAEKTACTTAVDEDKDIGNIVATPVRNPNNLQETTQIARLNNDRWAVVLGNGYNSTNERPVLLVQYLDGSKQLKRIQATTDAKGSGNAKDNGLSAPTLVDLNGDGRTDVVYAGDNLGNLWKFDLTSDSDSDWAVAFGSNKPLITVRGPVALGGSRDQVQPITAPAIVRANDRSMTVGTGPSAKTLPVGGMMVAFGTGRNLTPGDRRTDVTQNKQTLYSVLDNTRYEIRDKSKPRDEQRLKVHAGDVSKGIPAPAAIGTLAADGKPLAKQTIADISGLSGFAEVKATQALDKDTWSTLKGWYLDLPDKGERLLAPMQFWDGSNILAAYTTAPSGTKSSASDNINESCVPVKVDTSAGFQYRTLINIMDGKAPTIPLVDANNDKMFTSADKNAARMSVATGTPTLITGTKRILDYTGGGGSDGKPIEGARMPEQTLRPSWRQLK